MNCGTAARPGSITTIINTTDNSRFLFLETNAGDTNNSRRTSAAATAVVRRGWRWRRKLRWQRCGIAAVVEKICTESPNMPTSRSSRERGHRRVHGSAGSVAPTPEVAHTCHTFLYRPFGASASRLGCGYRCQAQRTASSVCFVLPCGLCTMIVVLLCLLLAWRTTV